MRYTKEAHMQRLRITLWLLMIFGALGMAPAAASAATTGAACVGKVEGIINPAVADYLDRAVRNYFTALKGD